MEQQQKNKQQWEDFFADIIRIHPAPVVIMLQVDCKNQISLIAAATTQEAMAITLKQAKPIYPEYIG